MTFDDGPDQGIIDGGKFRHPILKFALDAPPTFHLLNGATALLVSAPDGSSATLKMINGGGTAAERFKAAWTKSFPAEIAAPAPEVAQIGGMPSATGHVEIRVKDSAVRISLWLYSWTPTESFIYAAVDPKGTHASEHAATAQSFRRLTDVEAAAIQIRRMKIVNITAADSIASLSKGMAYADFREERFRLINGLFNGEPLPNSGPIKIVVWSPLPQIAHP
jgi:predicted Zn-dependent protease